MHDSVNNFLVQSSHGLYCVPGDFYLDPSKPVNRAVISHAHGDHAVPNSKTIYATAPTISLMQRRFRKSNLSEFVTLNYKETVVLNEVKLSFYPAGHMLGSAQVLMEYNGERYLYTGDFKLQKDDSCEAFEFVSCEYLITETTFADPVYNHPEPAEQMNKLNKCSGNILLGAYAIGKAQRITRLLSDYCPGKRIFVHSDLHSYHRIYENYGFSLGEWQPYSKQEFMNGDHGICILPPNQFSRYSRNKSVIRYFATGWTKPNHRCDEVLSISDHADWNDVLTLIEKTGARKIYTVHGDGSALKSHLNSSGIEVTLLHR